jgi:hypothetical protein
MVCGLFWVGVVFSFASASVGYCWLCGGYGFYLWAAKEVFVDQDT